MNIILSVFPYFLVDRPTLRLAFRAVESYLNPPASKMHQMVSDSQRSEVKYPFTTNNM